MSEFKKGEQVIYLDYSGDISGIPVIYQGNNTITGRYRDSGYNNDSPIISKIVLANHLCKIPNNDDYEDIKQGDLVITALLPTKIETLVMNQIFDETANYNIHKENLLFAFKIKKFTKYNAKNINVIRIISETDKVICWSLRGLVKCNFSKPTRTWRIEKTCISEEVFQSLFCPSEKFLKEVYQ